MKTPAFLRRLRAATGIEYAVIVGLVALVVVLALAGTGQEVARIFGGSANSITANTTVQASDPSDPPDGPAAFSFTPAANADPGAFVASNTVTPTGYTGSLPVTVSGADGQIAINGGGWTTSGTLSPGETLAVGGAASSSDDAAVTVTVTVGSTSEPFTITSGSATPASFSFPGLSNQLAGQLVTSSAVTPTGYTVSVPLSVSGDGSPEISVDGGQWETSGTISPGQSIKVELTPQAANATATAVVTVGNTSGSWSVNTGSQFPVNFTPATAFNEEDGLAYATTVVSGNATGDNSLTGGQFDLGGDPSAAVSLDGGTTWKTAAADNPISISNANQTFELKVTSASSDATATTATLTAVGTSSPFASFTAKTGVATPTTDLSTLNLSNQAVSTQVTSGPIALAGVTVTGGVQAYVTTTGSGAQICDGSVDSTCASGGAGWTSAGTSAQAVTIQNGDTLSFRFTTGASNSTNYALTLNILSNGQAVSYATGVWTVGTAAPVCSNATVALTETGVDQSVSVPAGCDEVTIKAWGAGGAGGGGNGHGGAGGAGAFATGVLTALSGGDALDVVVGQGGLSNTNANLTGAAYGGGGQGDNDGGSYPYSGGGGGGRSSVYGPSGSEVLVAAGGGGGGWENANEGGAGGGGGANGANGGTDTGSDGGGGASQSAGGAPGSYSGYSPTAGSSDTGGNASGSAAGGGAGYYGGGGGAANGGGGGGSSYVAANLSGSTQAGGGQTPPETSDPSYQSGVGVGANASFGNAAAPGGNGLVVLTWGYSVTAEPPPPVAANESFSVDQNPTIASLNLATGESGGAASSVVVVTLPTNGTLSNGGSAITSPGTTVSGTTTLSYIPNVGASSDSFIFELENSVGTSSTATATITVSTCPGGTVTLTTPGQSTVTIPSGCGSAVVTVNGGTGSQSNGAGGGVGGQATGTITLSQLTGSLIAVVGAAGGNSAGSYSGLFNGSVSQANAILIAGGGGMGSDDGVGGAGGGGAGGGTDGANGSNPGTWDGTHTAYGGDGGTTTAAGSGNPGGGALAGGGNGASGYWGGGGGTSDGGPNGPGGGGSGYCSNSANASAASSPVVVPDCGGTTGGSGAGESSDAAGSITIVWQ